MDKFSGEIINVLNHNALICKNKYDEMFVIFGKGIGFKKKIGETFVKTDGIQNSMMILSNEEAVKYKKLLNQVKHDKLINIVQDIVYHANQVFESKVNAKLNISLLDHLNFAWQRQENNIIINYPFLNELQFIYPKEYKFAEQAFYYINKSLNKEIIFDKSEIGFLVLHIHAALKNEKISDVLLNREIIYQCVILIEKYLKEKISYESIYYARFTKHLEFAIYRYKKGIKLQNILLNSVKDICKEEYKIANKVNLLLNKQYHINLDENELGYLTLHIYNLKNRNGGKVE